MYGASGIRYPLTRKRHNPRILSLVVPLSCILRHGFGGSAGIVASSSPLDCAVSRTLPCGALDVGSSAACVIARALYGIASGDADADAIGTGRRGRAIFLGVPSGALDAGSAFACVFARTLWESTSSFNREW